ncbi:DUF1016 N-terminal domain-containing protein [Azovibrio restrictus]|uniref:DUF1016 N-terminal domain-containing protein n=1 Tax=Azovibrio restrictus TaxID=146938 RepID=UPI0034E96708
MKPSLGGPNQGRGKEHKPQNLSHSALIEIYWLIGHRIRTEAQGNERAIYGEQIVSTLSRQLEADHGHGLSAKNLRHILRLPKPFPRKKLSPQRGDN